jgi:hypothetical protein
MTFIETPKAADVLCGKDKTFGKHPGNMLYRDLIEAKALDYAAAIYKLDKMKLTTEIVATMVNEFGTRFLRPVGIPTNKEGTHTCSTGENGTSTATIPITSDGNATTSMIGWEEISLTAARDKTSHALRFCAANTVANSNRAAHQIQKQSCTNSNMDVSDGTQEPPTQSANALPTSLIQSQLQASLGAKEVLSQEELIHQQNIALQRGIEDLVQQKMKQKELEQRKLEVSEQICQQPQEHLPGQEQTDAAADAVAITTTANGLRKFKKLPTKASVSIPKLRQKIIPTAELLNSTATPVKLSRVKVQKSSRKPKTIKPLTTKPSSQPMQPQMGQQRQYQYQQNNNFQVSLMPSQVSPSSSPFTGHEHYQSQRGAELQHEPAIPEQRPLSSSSNNARTVSTDMIVLAHAAAVVEAAEAKHRAAVAQQRQPPRQMVVVAQKPPPRTDESIQVCIAKE